MYLEEQNNDQSKSFHRVFAALMNVVMMTMQGVPQPPQPPITTPSPTPSPTTPPTVPTPPTPTPTKQVGPLEKIAGDLNTLHQDTFGFQQKKQGAGLQQQDGACASGPSCICKSISLVDGEERASRRGFLESADRRSAH